MKKTANWETSTGNKVTATVTFYSSNILGECYADLNVFVEGKGPQGGLLYKIKPQRLNGVTVTHRVGNLGITDEQAEIIHTLKKEIAETPEWEEALKKAKKAKEGHDAYDRSNAKIHRIMGY